MWGYPPGHPLYQAGCWYVNKSINQEDTLDLGQQLAPLQMLGVGGTWLWF